MTKLVLDPLDIPDRWYEIALSKAAPLHRVLLAKSGGSHVTHKYIMKKPDGKGGWVYYYRKEGGELYASGERPQRDVAQWLATIRGALSRLRKQMGDNPTPAQTARMKRLQAEQEHALKAKKAGQTHAEDMHHAEDEEKPKASTPKPEAAPEPEKPKRTPGRAIRDDFDEENKNVMQSWDMPIDEKLAFYEKKAASLRAIKARTTAWINEAGSRSEMDERREDTSDIYAASDRVEATLRKVKEEHAKTQQPDPSATRKRAASAASDKASEHAKTIRGSQDAADYENLAAMHSKAGFLWADHAKALTEQGEKRDAYDRAQDHRDKADAATTEAKSIREREAKKLKGEEASKVGDVQSQLASNPAFSSSRGDYIGAPPRAGSVFKIDGEPSIWLATRLAGEKNNKAGGVLQKIKSKHGDFAVHGSGKNYRVTHIPTGMSMGLEGTSLDRAQSYAKHMAASGAAKFASSDPKALFGVGMFSKEPVTYDMKAMSEARVAWLEGEKKKLDEKRAKNIQARPEIAPPKPPKNFALGSNEQIEWLSRTPYAASAEGVRNTITAALSSARGQMEQAKDQKLSFPERTKILTDVKEQLRTAYLHADYAHGRERSLGRDDVADEWDRSTDRLTKLREEANEQTDALNEEKLSFKPTTQKDADKVTSKERSQADVNRSDAERERKLSTEDPTKFASHLHSGFASALKKRNTNVQSVTAGYKGTGNKSHQRQYFIHFKDGTPTVDVFVRHGQIDVGGVHHSNVPALSTKGKSINEVMDYVAAALRVHAKDKAEMNKSSKEEGTTMSNAHDYPAHIRKSFRRDGADALSKGLYKFAPYSGQSMPKIDAEYLPAYLDAFIEEAYEHERCEKAHGENTMGRVGDMADYWATFVFHELVSYMPSNANLSAACKKLGVDVTYVAQRIRDMNLLTPQNDYATVQGDFMGGYMESEIATAGLVRKGGSLYDEVFAASETERGLGAIDRGRLAKSEREYVTLEGGVDPMAALRKSADARDAALGSLYGTDDAVTADPKAGLNWFDR